MGMFDRIVLDKEIEISLPDEMREFSNVEYQTKSLENTLSTYLIDSDKHLYLIDRTNFFEEEILNEDLEKDLEKKIVNYHGIIRFYAYQTTDLVDCCVDFDAKFTDGLLQEIKLIDFKKIEHESTKAKIEKLVERQKVYNKKLTTKVGKFIRKFLHSIFRLFGLDTAVLSFSSPNITFLYRPNYQEKNYGLYFDEISDGRLEFVSVTIVIVIVYPL